MLPSFKASVLISLHQPQSEKKSDFLDSVLYYLTIRCETMNSNSPFLDISVVFFFFHKKNKQNTHENSGIIEFYNWMEFCKTTSSTH